MADDSKRIVRKVTATEQKDLEAAQKLKPKLRKFLIEQQRNKAAETAKEQKKQDELLLANDEVIHRASKVATIALLQLKVWQKDPPTLPMNWTKAGATSPELIKEMNQDVAGFAAYLMREYNNFLKSNTFKRGYLNPMDDKNIVFFWRKFNADLKLLITAEINRVKAGNVSSWVSIGKPKEKESEKKILTN